MTLPNSFQEASLASLLFAQTLARKTNTHNVYFLFFYGDLDNGASRGRTTHLFYSGNSATFNNSSTPSSKWNDNSSSGISITNISAAGDDMTITVSK